MSCPPRTPALRRTNPRRENGYVISSTSASTTHSQGPQSLQQPAPTEPEPKATPSDTAESSPELPAEHNSHHPSKDKPQHPTTSEHNKSKPSHHPERKKRRKPTRRKPAPGEEAKSSSTTSVTTPTRSLNRINLDRFSPKTKLLDLLPEDRKSVV